VKGMKTVMAIVGVLAVIGGIGYAIYHFVIAKPKDFGAPKKAKSELPPGSMG